MWDYFAEINRVVGTNYKFIMRMDEESFFHSPINYDLFHYMGAHDYEYAYRICSYEMNAIQQIMHNYTSAAKRMWGKEWARSRHWNGASCGFYNNWFIASLDFFRTDKVQHMLHWFDVQGYMYRDRLNDLVIQTAAVYNFCQPRKIHRFLDWTYEHFTLTKQGCPKWGALATGYNDDHANATVATFLKQLEVANCTMDQDSIRRQIPMLHVYYDYIADLSPTYNHLPMLEYENVRLVSVKAGRIDLPGRGERSG
jgi:alpha 1,2-mannosyltransferase